MTRRRWAVAGLALLASLTLGTAACQETPGGAGATPSATAKSATETLSEAAAKTRGQSFKFTLKWGDVLSGDGGIDTAAKKNLVNMALSDQTSGMRVQAGMLSIGDDAYLKLDLGALGLAIPGLADIAGKWMHVDATKLPADLTLGIRPGSSGVLDVNTYVPGVVSAEKTSSTEIKGRIDLAKSNFTISKDEIAKLPDDQRIVPFTATLDAEGRVSKLAITMPKVGNFPATEMLVTYSDWGSPVNAEKPAASDVVEAPPMLYQLFASM